MDKLILNDNTTIELRTGASLGALQVLSPDRAAMLATWEQLTPDNLAVVQIQDSTGLTVGRYEDLVLESETSVVRPDGSILTTYHLREKTELERLSERIGDIETGQDVQDGAIADMAAVTSVIADKVEGVQA